ncbi:MAG: phytanoyl-CoA dioxygenase family protein [Leptolyngbyaceae cyanobacterium]
MKSKIVYNPLLALIYLPVFAIGFVIFTLTGNTPTLSFISFRKLYCITRGQLNKGLRFVFRRLYNRAYTYPVATEGVLFKRGLASEEYNLALNGLRKNGYYKFRKKLDPDLVKRLREFSKNSAAIVHGGQARIVEKVNFTNPAGPKYEIDPKEFYKSAALAELALDSNLYELASAYLQTAAILDLIAMWWLLPYASTASTEAAQLFHFDMDRISFLKFFVYLTDVGPKNGPHTYVRGSHVYKPRHLFQDRRFNDFEIEKSYGADKIDAITGSSGTIIAADTSGFHKGGVVDLDSRLILQVEFASSLFGQNYPPHRLAKSKEAPAYRHVYT